MRAIDSDALKKQFCEDCGRMCDNPNCKEEECAVIDVVDMMPTIDVQPVKHGKWLICSDGYYPYCSECRNEPKSGIMTKYCPECGAKMDKKEATYIKDVFMTR